MPSLATRRFAAGATLALAVAGCANSTDARIGAPTEPAFGKKVSVSNTGSTMTITPTAATIPVGETATVSVTYRDSKGNAVPDANMRITYYGCFPVAPAGATCNDLVLITPVMPYLRQAHFKGLMAGKARIYASDGVGTYVYADLTIQ